MLSTLNAFKAAGTDGVHPGIVWPLAELPAVYFAQLFNASLRERKVPAKRGTASVVRTFENGPRHRPENYTPMGLTRASSWRESSKRRCALIESQYYFTSIAWTQKMKVLYFSPIAFLDEV